MSLPSSNWAARAFQKTFTNVFYSRFPPTRRRRPASRPVAIESLEGRRLLAVDPNLGWIKIDLSNLDQTGVTPAYDIYIQGSANTSGQILQYDPTLVTPEGTGGLVFTTPLPSPVTFTSANYTPVAGDPKSITLSTAAELFAGGSVKFSGGTTSTIASITANVTAGSWAPPSTTGPGGKWDAFPSSQVTGSPKVVIQSGSLASGTLDGITLTGANGPAVSTSGMSIGSLVVGTKNPGSNQTYFFNNDGGGLPFPTSGPPAGVTQIGPDSQSSGIVDVTFSATSSQTNLALVSDFLTVFSGGLNGGFATYVGAASQTTSIPASLGGGSVQEVTVGKLLSTGQVKPTDLSGFNPDSTAAQGNQPQPKSFLVVDGLAGIFPIYGIDSFTITFADAVPANASVTFETTVAATATSATTFTIDAGPAGIPGIIAGLSLGLQPTLSQNGVSTSALNISALALDSSTNTITVTLSGGNMPWSSGAMKVDLPPTGGFLPTTKWSATDAKSNTIWARQTSAGSTSNQKISVNGSRIYFSFVTPGDQPPLMPYAQGSAGLSVTQFKPEDIWNGTVPLSQYLELTADALSGGPGNGDGLVYLDLSAVDGFFFPAALSTTVNGNKLVIGQASGTYVPPTTTTGPTTYSAVSRQEILNAYDAFFTNTTNTSSFASGATALQQAYAGLHVKSSGASIGIQNPTFLDWSTPSAAATALNAAWDNDLNALFTTSSNQVNLLGDKNSTAWSVVNAIQVGSQGSGYAVGDVITFTAPSGGGRAATAKVKTVNPTTQGIVEVTITDPGVYPTSGETPTVSSISGSGQGATLNVVAMVPATTFYKGVPTAATGTASGSNPNTLVLTEYVGQSVISSAGQYAPPTVFAYTNLYATGVVFTVFDPRTVPASETQAFNPVASGSPTPMAVGQQILGNFGVFASTTLNTASPNPNYASTGTDPWSPGDALAQLNALQRDIVWALNQGNGGIPAALTPTEPGSTTAYWTNEENWYPYPSISSGGKYQAQTPQNLFAQWVHTAGSAGGPAIGPDKYFATFPFGNLAGTVPNQDYGQPTKAWGPTGAGTGPLMNQTYGFAYDESPAHGIAGANVPSKFLPIPNAANDTLTFQLVFGPWNASTPTKPSAPTSVVAVSGNAQLAVTWTAPASDGGSAITDYLVKYSSNNGSTWTNFVHSVSTATSCTVTGLTNGTPYVIKVIAKNAVGISLPSANSAPATPAATVPGSPTSVVATPGNASLAVTWTAPASTGGSAITDYLVKYSSNGGSTWKNFVHSASPATSLTVTGLTNGTPYVIKVIARNAVGISLPSSNSAPATPAATVPSAPTSVVALSGNASLAVTWTAPVSTGGSAITEYLVKYSSNSGASWTRYRPGLPITATACTVTGLTNGTPYVIKVIARNAVGISLPSASSAPATPAATVSGSQWVVNA